MESPGNFYRKNVALPLEESLESIRSPQMDVIDRDKDILIRVELPGVEKKDVDVSVSNGTLNIKGGVKRESKEQRKDYFRCEIAQGNFSRSLSIPPGIDKTNIGASLKDGICLLYTSPSPRDRTRSRMPSSA